MFEKIKTFIKGIGIKMGLIQDIKGIGKLVDKIDLQDEAYQRIELNKQIYKGYVKKWHHLHYLNSMGDPKERDMKRIGMGKIAATKLAKLIFNEKCEIDIDDESAKEYVGEMLKDNKFYRDFPRYLEYCYALGGVALKVYAHENKVKIAYATADAFIPLSSDSQNIDEAVFITKEKKDKKTYTLLETHQWEGDIYVVTNELYESESENQLGSKVKLSTLYEDLQERTEIAGLSRPLFIYLKPNTANNKDLTSPLGISIYENSYDTLYQLDYLFDFLHHEFKLGKRRISVNRGMLKPVIDEQGNVKPVFDSDETVFQAIGIEDDDPIRDLSVGLRVNEIVAAINVQLDLLAMQMGLSAGTFTFDGRQVLTATQVISENSATYQTKNSHALLVEDAIKDLVISIIELANLYGYYSGTSDVDVTVNFDDSIAEDRGETYNYYSTAVKDKLYTKTDAIMKIFKVTEEEAKNIQAEIMKEDALAIQKEVALNMELIGMQQEVALNNEIVE